MTRAQAQALLDRYLGQAPILPTPALLRADWFVGLVQAAYAQGHKDAQIQRGIDTGARVRQVA